MCTGCEAVWYCDSKCQKEHFKEHSVLCRTIKVLSAQQSEKIDERCTFSSHLTPDDERKLVKLVGRRCTVECEMGDGRSKSKGPVGYGC